MLQMLFYLEQRIQKKIVHMLTLREGRQFLKQAVFPPGEAKEVLENFLRAFSDYVDCKLPFDSLDTLREKIYSDFPHFEDTDIIKKNPNYLEFGRKEKN